MSTSNTAGQKMTDAELAKLEKRIAAIYREAYNDLTDTIRDYFGKFAARDAAEKARMDAGEISEDQYKQWRLAQIGRGRRFEALRDKVAERMTNANVAAVAYVNDATPGIYSLNRNFAAYTIEQVTGDVGFDIWDEQTVKRLISEQPELMPYYPEKRALNRGIDLAYGKKQITASVTSSILQGRSIKGMADDLQSRITTMNRDSAIRTARTAVTGAQNAGRLDSFYAAEKMGIKCRKQWIATLDGRTRHSHAMLDGEIVDNDKKFSNGCRYPGDPQGRPEEIYNCFVGETQIASDGEIVRSYKHEYCGELIEIETSGGVKFACTPNHPILTPSGWVAAALLNNGDDLLVAGFGNGMDSRGNPYIDHVFPRMDALHELLDISFGQRIRTLRVNFHGDAPASEVEIVAQKRLLWSYRNAFYGKSVNKFLLKIANEALMGKRPLMKHFWGVCKSALRFVSCLSEPLSFICGGLRHTVIHGFGAVSNVNTSMVEPTIDDLPTDPIFLREFLNGFSGKVITDNIIRVNRVITKCHVYNLQTTTGHYFVNSSIPQNGEKYNGNFAIAHNCRCTLVSEIEGIDTSGGKRRARNQATGRNDLIENMTYAEWAGWKQGTNKVADGEESAIIKTYRQFDTGDAANNFFYYDGDERGLLAKKRSKHAQWQKSLTEDEDYAIGDYTGGGYYDINSYLRKTGDWENINAEFVKQQIKGLDSAISRYELKDNIRVQRGVMNDVVDRLVEDNDVQDSLSELIGKKFRESAYSSTTAVRNNGVATAKPTILDIEIPAGTGRGAYVNQLAGQFQDTEYEFLLKRGSTFTIKEVREDEIMGEYHYYIRMVMDVE